MAESTETGALGSFSSATAKKLITEINRLEKHLGRLPNDEEVLEAARDPKSALHALVFDKSVEDAAQAYYIARVQYVMRHLAAITATANGDKVKFRLFTRTDDGYERTTEIEPASATAAAISRRLMLDIEAAKRRAEAWRAILGLPQKSRADAVIKHLDMAQKAAKPQAKKKDAA